MLIKVLIVLVFIAILVSLTSSLVFLLKDMNVPESKRGLYALGVRISLAATLLCLIAYGFESGQLNSTAPWDHFEVPQHSN